MSEAQLKQVVFPVAGLGSRFLPVTKSIPKEMLPIVDKPLIQYAVEEAITAGIKELIFVRFSKWSRMSEIGMKNDIVITRNTNARASIILSTKMVLIPVANLIDDF